MANEYYLYITKSTVLEALETLNGDTGAFTIFVVLLMHQNNKDGLCYPSYRKLVEETKLSLPTIQAKIKKLEDAKLIKIQKIKNSSFHYIILTPEGFNNRKNRKNSKESKNLEDSKDTNDTKNSNSTNLQDNTSLYDENENIEF